MGKPFAGFTDTEVEYGLLIRQVGAHRQGDLGMRKAGVSSATRIGRIHQVQVPAASIYINKSGFPVIIQYMEDRSALLEANMNLIRPGCDLINLQKSSLENVCSPF